MSRSRDYPRLGIEEFGDHLLRTEDLDPVYCAAAAIDDRPTLRRWLLAYWCYYHAGAASFLAELEGGSYWKAMWLAARNDEPAPTGGRWPRGRERRHFRGRNALASLSDLGRYRRPEDFCRALEELCPTDFTVLSNAVQQHRGFGPWIAFKVADMVERVLQLPVDFEAAAVFMYDEPKDAAILLYEERRGELAGEPGAVDEAISDSVAYLRDVFGGYPAPPWGDRTVGLQEIETILCKYKSHLGGHYPLNNDLVEVREGLADWAPFSVLARRLLDAVPEVNEWAA